MKRIVIAGGAGLIGRALAAEMITAGYEVIVLSRQPEQVDGLPQGARAEKWDGRTVAGWSTLIQADTTLVNLAGASIGSPPLPWTPARKSRIRESRLNAGRAIVEAIRAAREKPRALIQASAIGYYGLRGDETLTEKNSAGADFLSQVGVDWEASTAAVEPLGVRRAIIRTGVVLSARGGALPLLALPVRWFAGGPLGSGRQWISWIHLADQVGAIRFLIENENARGAFNLSAPQPVTNLEMVRALGRVLRRPVWLPVPGWALKFALGELAELLLLGGQRVAPERLQQLGYAFRFAEVDAALRDLLG